MEDSKFKAENLHNKTDNTHNKIKESANDLLNESKKMASEIYEQGKETVGEKVSEAEEYIREYSDRLVNKIQTNPLGSVLVAVGVGMLLSSMLKK
jgi:ElaB/YqjD/DUF883 family membrane-anchored ribosome-binding protein